MDMNDLLAGLSNFPIELPEKRKVCAICRRPIVVCWCSYLPKFPINCHSRIILLQHPSEEKRHIRTASMIPLCINREKCIIYQGSHFPIKKHVGLDDILQSPSTILLYPSRDATDIMSLPKAEEENSISYNILIIDSTWPQSINIYNRSPNLHSIKKVKLMVNNGSKYVIRTQPTQKCLSTIETVAEALSILENKPEYFEILMKPLEALCEYQLTYGAVHHDSRERRLTSKVYPENVGKKLKNFLASMRFEN